MRWEKHSVVKRKTKKKVAPSSGGMPKQKNILNEKSASGEDYPMERSN